VDKPPSLQDVIRRRRDQIFVGRQDHVSIFEQNLGLPPDDDRRRFVFNISGPAGVGKTSLMYRFRQLAEASDSLTAWIPGPDSDPVATMATVADQFERRGHKLKTFDERYRLYRQRRHELESDPSAPHGLINTAGRTAGLLTLRLARDIPVAGAVADLIDDDTFANQFGEFASYVAKKVANQEDASLLLDPSGTLTKLFAHDLSAISDALKIVIFIDGYEQFSDALDDWLRCLLEGAYGDLPTNFCVVVAGQDELDPGPWTPFEAILSRIQLQPFTNEELTSYLKQKGVANHDEIAEIARVTENLPLMVAVLTAGDWRDIAANRDLNSTAVDRFLRNITDPAERQFAIDAALPRRLDRDVVGGIVEDPKDQMFFERLKSRPFVQERRDGWIYHDLVRRRLLRQKRRESAEEWSNLHARLAAFYAGRIPPAPDIQPARTEPPSGNHLELLYHRLCQAPDANIPGAISDFLLVAGRSYTWARRWAETIRQAGSDAEESQLASWGSLLVAGLRGYQQHRLADAIDMYARILEDIPLNDPARKVALTRRGFAYQETRDYARAVTDFEAALALVHDDRGERFHLTHHLVTCNALLQRYEEAHNVLSHADPDADDPERHTLQGYVYLLEQKPDAALDELASALTQPVPDSHAWYWMGRAHMAIGDYQEAAQDLTKHHDFRPQHAATLYFRALAFRELTQFDDALSDLLEAVSHDPDSAHAAQKQIGLTYLAMADYEKACDAFIAALQEVPACVECWEKLVGAYAQLLPAAHVPAAVNSVEIQTEDRAGLISCRGIAMVRGGYPREGVDDLDVVLASAPDDRHARYYRATGRMDLGDTDGAISDLGELILRSPNDSHVRMIRSHLYESIGRYEEAARDLDVVISANPSDPDVRAMSGLAKLMDKDFAGALADLNVALKLEPDANQVLCCRSLAHAMIGNIEKAKEDIFLAIDIASRKQQLDPDDTDNVLNLGLYNLLAGDGVAARQVYQEVLHRNADLEAMKRGYADLIRVMQLLPDDARIRELASAFDANGYGAKRIDPPAY